MTLDEIIRRFRVLADDKVLPYLFADEDVKDWINDAIDEAAIRARLLLEDANPALCQIAVVVDTFSYPLHTKLYELVRVRFKPTDGSDTLYLKIVTREWLDERVIDWRDEVGNLCYAIQDDSVLRLVGIPDKTGVLHLEGYRLPLVALDDGDDQPEINGAHHVYLIQWALHKAFGRPDTETFDAKREAMAEKEFTRYFGLRPDSDLRRSTRNDSEQHNKAW